MRLGVVTIGLAVVSSAQSFLEGPVGTMGGECQLPILRENLLHGPRQTIFTRLKLSQLQQLSNPV